MNRLIRVALMVLTTPVLLITGATSARSGGQIPPRIVEGSPPPRGAVLTPSPEGRIYRVTLTSPRVFSVIDCWEFGPDGQFNSQFLGTADWEIESRSRSSAIWSGAAGGGLVFLRFAGITYPAGGRGLLAVGIEVIDPVEFPFIARGTEDPVCTVDGVTDP